MQFLTGQIRRFWKRVIWSLDGWRDSWRSEDSLKQWTGANVISVALTFAFEMTSVERILIVAFGLLVLAAELMNTAIEEAVNRISTDEHPLSKKAKDAGSAAVAMTAITAGVVWLLVLFT